MTFNAAWKNSVDFRLYGANQNAATEPDLTGQSQPQKQFGTVVLNLWNSLGWAETLI